MEAVSAAKMRKAQNRAFAGAAMLARVSILARVSGSRELASHPLTRGLQLCYLSAHPMTRDQIAEL